MTRNRMRPIHPGEILREEFLVPLGMSAPGDLNAEALGGRRYRILLIIMPLSPSGASYEPGGGGFESCGAREFSKAYEPQTRSFFVLPDLCRTFYPQRGLPRVRDAQHG